MPFIIYALAVILISLVSIIAGNAIVFAENILNATIITIAITICLFILLIKLIKILLKKFVLTIIYFPVLLLITTKLSIIIIDYFDKQNPPF